MKSIRKKTCFLFGFSLVEILVVIAIIALLAGLLMPSLFQAKELARQAVCANNLKQMSLAHHLYANDQEDWLPRAGDCHTQYWYENSTFMDYLELETVPQRRTVITCPTHETPWEIPPNVPSCWVSYGMNAAFGCQRDNAFQSRRRVEFSPPSSVLAFGDAKGVSRALGILGWQDCFTHCDSFRHNERMQVVYLDGHVGSREEGSLVHDCEGVGVDLDFWGCYWMKPPE
jgi:prepilin-type N-terminal cleavage/methylation domain-containing protein/prepilin-type processing-associated H-X9-DG protein